MKAPLSPGTAAGPAEPAARSRILVVGGDHVGMHAALHLQRKLKPEIRRGEAEIVVVAPEPSMPYQPFLPEAAAGTISPRHALVPLRRLLHRCRLLIGEATSIDVVKRTAALTTLATREEGTGAVEVGYDELVLTPGTVTHTPPAPGLDRHGIGLRTVDEAIRLRNHVVEQLDIASSTRDPALREAALTFVFAGGGHTGVAALGELEDMARHAARSYPTIQPGETKWILVHPAERVLPEAHPELATHALRQLRRRNIDVRLNTRLESCDGHVAVLDDGSRFATRTLVWTGDPAPHPILATTDLPLDERGRVTCTPHLAVDATPHAWTAGDAAAIPDLTTDEPAATCPPGAQHAPRQARVLARNIAAALRGRPLEEYRHVHGASTASLGLHKAVAQVHGRTLKGYPAWFMHRLHHLSRVPTTHSKARMLAEWTLSGLFTRDIVALGSLVHPRAEFELPTGAPRPRYPKGSS